MPNTKVTAIPYVRRSYRDTYANLPTTGLRVGDFGFATDRLVLYRWSGAAWEAQTLHWSSGVAANIPTAADLPNGSGYYETDTTLLKQVQAGAWATIVNPPSYGAEYCPLEAVDCQVNAGTGTADNPERLNDALTNADVEANVIGEFVEVDLGNLYKFTQWRQFGSVANNGDGVSKLEYLDADNVWQTWVASIAPRATADWSNWSSETEVYGHKLKLTCTTVDSSGKNRTRELEVKF